MHYRKQFVARRPDGKLLKVVTAQLKAVAIKVKAGPLVDATIIAPTSESDADGSWVMRKGKSAGDGSKAHVGADATTALVEKNLPRPQTAMMDAPVEAHCLTT